MYYICNIINKNIFMKKNKKMELDINRWFDGLSFFKDGFACIRLNDKHNFINTKGDIISEQWFDFVDDFFDGFAEVRLKDKGWNFINTEGEIISNQWFDKVWDFCNGFAKVALNDKMNFINKKGEIFY
jgi:hypothetical protein